MALSLTLFLSLIAIHCFVHTCSLSLYDKIHRKAVLVIDKLKQESYDIVEY